MIEYSQQEHGKYINHYFYVLCIKSQTEEETVTKENFDVVLNGLRTHSPNEEFHRNYAALRMLYFQQHVMNAFGD